MKNELLGLRLVADMKLFMLTFMTHAMTFIDFCPPFSLHSPLFLPKPLIYFSTRCSLSPFEWHCNQWHLCRLFLVSIEINKLSCKKWTNEHCLSTTICYLGADIQIFRTIECRRVGWDGNCRLYFSFWWLHNRAAQQQSRRRRWRFIWSELSFSFSLFSRINGFRHASQLRVATALDLLLLQMAWWLTDCSAQ